ncbi:hypothetical protein JW933_10760 [candidate division FCPU426 bacterium]|nr:hypothetical protein [candidate division FCPU426 bacterium]
MIQNRQTRVRSENAARNMMLKGNVNKTIVFIPDQEYKNAVQTERKQVMLDTLKGLLKPKE